MNEQHESEHETGDTEAHLYIPKDERTGATPDTEGHRRSHGRLDDADENDTLSDVEGHMPRIRGYVNDATEGDTTDDAEGQMPRMGRFLDAADKGDTTGDAEGHRRMASRLDAADESDMVDDVEGHGPHDPGDPVSDSSVVRGRDGRGRR